MDIIAKRFFHLTYFDIPFFFFFFDIPFSFCMLSTINLDLFI